MADTITQAKHTARVFINEARMRRIGNGHDIWSILTIARLARRRVLAMEASTGSKALLNSKSFKRSSLHDFEQTVCLI